MLRRFSRAPRVLPPAAALLLALLLVACGPSEPPPPTSPLDDRQPQPTAPPGVDPGTPPPLNGANDGGADDGADGAEDLDMPSTPRAGNGPPAVTPAPGTDPTPDEEAAAARGIDLMAEWLGVSASDLEFVSVEAVDWPSACIGVERPDLACAEVITPGWRIELQTLLRHTVHHVHASESGRFAWAPEREAEATVTSIDRAAATIEVETGTGTEHWLVVPGSELEPALADLVPGTHVIAGLDQAPDGTAVVWLVAVG